MEQHNWVGKGQPNFIFGSSLGFSSAKMATVHPAALLRVPEVSLKGCPRPCNGASQVCASYYDGTVLKASVSGFAVQNCPMTLPGPVPPYLPLPVLSIPH